MNHIALAKEDEVLKYLCNGLPEGRPDTAAARCEEQKGLEVFRKTAKMLSLKCMKLNHYQRICENSFSRVEAGLMNGQEYH